MCELSPVSFHGDTIFCVEFDGQPFTPMKPIVENMGLDWGTQYRKLNDNKERWGIVIMTIPSDGGEQETICMPVRKLPAWLASINPKKVKPELRIRIELYQSECDDVLWDYWAKGKAERKPSAPTEIRSVKDLYALRYAQYANLPPLEKRSVARRIGKRLQKRFGYEDLKKIPQEQWQEAIILITAPALPQGNMGLVRKVGQTPMAQTVRPVLMPEAVPASLQEVLDTLEDIRKKCEQCLHVIYRYKGSDYTDCRYNMFTRLKLHSFETLDLAKNMIITLGHFSRA